MKAFAELPSFINNILEKKRLSFFDVRAQKIVSNVIQISDGSITQMSQNIVSGIGVRGYKNGLWGFASTTNLEDEKISELCMDVVKAIRTSKKQGAIFPETKPVTGRSIVKPEIDPSEVSNEVKIGKLLNFEKMLKNFDSRIKSTQIKYSDSVEQLIIFNSEGTNVTMYQPRIDISFNVVANDGEHSQHTRGRQASMEGFEFINNEVVEATAIDTAKRSLDLLEAKSAPSGKSTVVMDPSVAGLFLHEAFGHAAEADTVLQGRSFLSELLEKKVASPKVTVYSDPTVSGSQGSYAYDSEGVPAIKVSLIEKGVLKSFMHSRSTAALYGVNSTSNARAEDYGKPPIVRMNNMYFEPGDATKEEIIEETKSGVYLVSGGGGLEDPEKGRFQFSIQNAYEIEDGEIGSPLKGTSLSGWTLETMLSIDMLGRKTVLDIGSCGKGEPIMQIAPVANGGPHIRLNNVLLGG